MKIEDVTKATLEQAEDHEVYALRIRFIQFYKKHFLGNTRKAMYDLAHDDMLGRYALLMREIDKRNLKNIRSHEIDVASFREALIGINMREFADIELAKDFVCISGDFAKNPQRAQKVDITVCTLPHKELEVALSPLIKQKTNKETAFAFDSVVDGTVIPLYDLVLRLKPEAVRKQVKTLKPPKKKAATSKKPARPAPQQTPKGQTPADKAQGLRERLEARKTQPHETIKKPEETATQIRIPVGPPCTVTATIVIDAAKGIKALYCGAEKRIRTYLFDNTKWTMATAKAWVEEHKKEKQGGPFSCECLDCGHTMESTQHCAEIECPNCGGTMRRAERPGPGQKSAAIDVTKELSTAQRKECDAETERIKTSSQRPIAAQPHQFKAAKYTHPNGHPRCLTCGNEQPIGNVCNMKEAWYETHEWDDDAAWAKERTKLRNKGVIKDEWLFKIYKQVKSKQIVGGVVYEPEVVDTQGDITSADEIREAMYHFMEKYAVDTSRIKVQHAGHTYQFPILETFQPEQNITRGGKTVKKGSWWMMVKVTNDAVWKDITDGRLNAFSMGGTATAAKNKT